MRKLGWVEEKTSSSNIGLPSKSLIACRNLRRTWVQLRVDLIVTTGGQAALGGKANN